MNNIREEFKILDLIKRVGLSMLKNGSEIYRVEKATVEIGKYFNYNAQCFATLTCMVITLTNNDGEVFSLVERVEKRDVNLNKVNKLHELIYNINNYTYEEILKEIDSINNSDKYSYLMNYLGYILGAGFFVFLFKGDYKEFLVAMITGFTLALINDFIVKVNLNSLFSNVIFGMICALIPSLFVKVNFIQDIGIPTISALMINVPGVPFINAIRDIFSGDLVSATSRLLEVVLIAMALSIGSGIILKLFII